MCPRVDQLPRGYRPPLLEAQAHRFRGRLNADVGAYGAAIAGFVALGMPFWVAVSRLELAELLGGGEEAESLLAEARDEFERLRAAPWLERASAAGHRPARVPACARRAYGCGLTGTLPQERAGFAPWKTYQMSSRGVT